jgi:hypothetical protein
LVVILIGNSEEWVEVFYICKNNAPPHVEHGTLPYRRMWREYRQPP